MLIWIVMYFGVHLIIFMLLFMHSFGWINSIAEHWIVAFKGIQTVWIMIENDFLYMFFLYVCRSNDVVAHLWNESYTTIDDIDVKHVVKVFGDAVHVCSMKKKEKKTNEKKNKIVKLFMSSVSVCVQCMYWNIRNTFITLLSYTYDNPPTVSLLFGSRMNMSLCTHIWTHAYK